MKKVFYYQEIIKPKVEEVRYLENEQLKTRKPTVADFFICSPSPEEQKEAAKKIVGTGLETADIIAPPVGGPINVATGIVGEGVEGFGEAIGNQDAKDFGKVLKEGAQKPLEDTKKGVKKFGESLEEIFE